MISMTGFGSAQADCSLGLVSCELRSVNSRFFELQTRIPDELRPYVDPWIRERLTAALPRGKVELRLSVLRAEAPATPPAINPRQLEALIALGQSIHSQANGLVQPWQMADLLRWPGVLQHQSGQTDRIEEELRDVIEAALGGLLTARAREGEQLAQVLATRLTDLSQLTEQASGLMQEALDHLTEKMRTRLTEAFASMTHENLEAFVGERIRQEAHAASIRSDIREELDRLGAHIAQMKKLIQSGGGESVGKRLDFLTQELHREANTLGSKSPGLALTQLAMEMKLLVEQIREQVQNIQ